MFKTHRVLKIIGIVIVVIVAGAAVAVKLVMNPLLFSFDGKGVPAIVASPMKVSDIYLISKFRSEEGHDFSTMAWDGESCRSLKHYFNTSMNVNDRNLPVRSQPSPGHPNIAIYAPFDGKITEIDQEKVPIGQQIHFASAQNSSYFVILFHTDPLPSLHVGSFVKGGDQIGTVGPMDGIDVAYEAYIMPNFKIVYLSIFDYMTDSAFAPFAALGYKRSDFILTRTQADAGGYKCNGEQFTNQPLMNPGSPNPDMEVDLRPNPWVAIYDQQHHIGTSPH